MSNTSIYIAVSSTSQESFSPTYLCIKQHSITKLKYLCKSTRPHEEMLKYAGSGKYWKSHIKKHGVEHIETLWACLFTEKDELVKFALMCSAQWDIVDSKDWANLQPENGLTGGHQPGFGKGRISPKKGTKGKPQTVEANAKRTAALKGNKNSLGKLKGKTWEEIYGIEGAKKRRESRVGKTMSLELRQQQSFLRKGKTWEELYGIDSAAKRRAAHRERAIK